MGVGDSVHLEPTCSHGDAAGHYAHGSGRGSLSHLDGCVFIMPSYLALSFEFPFTHDELLRDQVCILGILPFFFFFNGTRD